MRRSKLFHTWIFFLFSILEICFENNAISEAFLLSTKTTIPNSIRHAQLLIVPVPQRRTRTSRRTRRIIVRSASKPTTNHIFLHFAHSDNDIFPSENQLHPSNTTSTSKDRPGASSSTNNTNNNNNKRLDYQHGFHAGNYADIFKHVILTTVLQKMKQSKKKKPIHYVETHAGSGLYTLSNGDHIYEAEFQRGIGRLIQNVNTTSNNETRQIQVPKQVESFLHLVDSFQSAEDSDVIVYPGSPMIAAYLLQQQQEEGKANTNNSLLLFEKSPSECDRLQHNLQQYLYTIATTTATTLSYECQCDNGYSQLAKYAKKTPKLPPRTLILIDPPYQYGSDTEQIVRLCQTLRVHWNTARIAIWHPVREDPDHADKLQRLYQQLRQTVTDCDMLAIEVYAAKSSTGTYDDHDDDDVGTGMILLQPPYGIQQELEEEVMPQLQSLLLLQAPEDGADGNSSTRSKRMRSVPKIRFQWL